MPFCHHCGAGAITGAAYCGRCGSVISISAAITTQAPAITNAPGSTEATDSRKASPVAITIQVPTIADEPRSPKAKSIKGTLNNIAAKLGIEKIAGFSPKVFCSEVLIRHEPGAVERLLSVGTLDTTPEIDASMGVMPRPWIFFRILCGAVAAYLILWLAWKGTHNVNLLPGLIIVESFAVPFSVLILFFELNSLKNISILKVTQLVVMGGAISLLMSFLFSEAAPLLGSFTDPAAGIVEEIGKLAALILVMRAVKGDRYKYRLNGLLLGAALGTGFAAVESAGYALRGHLPANTEVMLNNIQRLGALSPFSHIAWTAIAACAFWIVQPRYGNTWDTVRSTPFLKLFAIPVALHLVWNLPFDGPFMIKNLALGFLAWIVILGLVQYGIEEAGESVGPEKPSPAS